MKAAEIKQVRRKRRKLSVRRRLARPVPGIRLSVTRSIKHIQAQLIDDAAGRTLCTVSTTAKRLGTELGGKTKSERAAYVGGEIARLAKERGIETVIFDRGSSRYHGRVKALAEAAREGGLKF